MTGHSEFVTKVVFELAMSQLAYVMSAVARKAGPSERAMSFKTYRKAQQTITALRPAIIVACQRNWHQVCTSITHLPHGPVKAVPSILNLGSARPPVETVPLGFDTCCRAC